MCQITSGSSMFEHHQVRVVDEWLVVGTVGGCEDGDNYWGANAGNIAMGFSDTFPALTVAQVAG